MRTRRIWGRESWEGFLTSLDTNCSSILLPLCHSPVRATTLIGQVEQQVEMGSTPALWPSDAPTPRGAR